MNPKVIRGIVVVTGLFGAALLGLYLGAGKVMIPLAVLAALAAAVALARIDLVYGLTLILLVSQVTVPLLPQRGNLYLLSIPFLTFAAAPFWLLQKHRHMVTPGHVITILLFLLILILIQFRGFGLQIAGSGVVGGFRYFSLFAAMAFFFAGSVCPMKPRQFRWLILAVTVASAVPFGVELLLRFNPTAALPFLYFVEIDPVSVQSFLTPGSETDPFSPVVNRFFTGKQFALWLSIALFVLLRPHQWFSSRLLPAIPIGTLIVGASMLSGYRLAVLNLVLVAGIYFWVSRQVTFARVFALVLFILLGLAALAPVAEHLPLSAQRILSAIPGVEVDYIAEMDAFGTVEWRIQVWKNAIRDELPEYLLLGKGFTFDPRPLEYLVKLLPVEAWAGLTSSYHNGPLSILITTGIPGLVLMVLFSWVTLVRHWQLDLKREWASDELRHIHFVFTAVLTAAIAVFWTLYGDLFVSLPEMLIWLGILECVVVSDDRYAQEFAPGTDVDNESSAKSLVTDSIECPDESPWTRPA